MSDQLAALAAQADGIDQDAQQMEPGAVLAAQQDEMQAAQNLTLLEENKGGLSMILELAAPAFDLVGMPTVGKVLAHEENKAKLIAVWAPVLTKHGIALSNLGAQWKEEITAIAVTFPILRVVLQAIKHDGQNADKEKAIEAPKAQAQEAAQAQAAGMVPKEQAEHIKLG
jgi:hypothetical protein